MRANKLITIINFIRRGPSWGQALRLTAWTTGVLGIIFVLNFLYFKPFSVGQFFERMFVQYAILHPEMASDLRAYTVWGWDEYMGRLNSLSEEDQAKSREVIHRNFEMLRRYKLADLSGQDIVSVAVLDTWLEETIFEEEGFPHQRYVADQFEGPQIRVPVLLYYVHQIRTIDDAEHYIRRVAAFGRHLDQVIHELSICEEFKTIPPQHILEQMALQAEALLSDNATDNAIYHDFYQKMDNLSFVSETGRSELLYEIRLLIEDDLLPTLQLYAGQLRQLKTKASAQPGVLSFDENNEYYRFALKKHLTEEINMDSLLLMAAQEREMVQARVTALLDSLGQPASEDMSIGQRIRAALVASPHPYRRDSMSKVRYITDLNNAIRQARILTGQWMPVTQSGLLHIEEVPAAYKSFFYAPYYFPASTTQSRIACLLINLEHMPHLPASALQSMAFRYGYPGLHLLKGSQRNNSQLPTLRQALDISLMTEGWQYHVLELAATKQAYTEPLALLCGLQMQLVMLEKIVLDNDIHLGGLSRQEAIEQLTNATGIEVYQAAGEIDEITVHPGKAPAALAGHLRISQCITNARQHVGQSFDEKAFYGVLLANGSVTAKALDLITLQYIQEQNGKGKEKNSLLSLLGMRL